MNFLPGSIMGFREGLEAFLIIVIILRYLTKIDQNKLKIKVYQGCIAGIIFSILLGIGLYLLSSIISSISTLNKSWESISSFIALALVTTFIIWMIRHGHSMTAEIKNQVNKNLSSLGIFFVSFIMIAREGTEIVFFTFAGKYSTGSISVGIALAFILSILIYYSFVNINLGLLFKITLIYLILQSGFLLGYSVHEGLSAFKEYGVIDSNNILLYKAFNLSATMFSHKDGVIGLPLYVLFGWYSKPEWLQFIIQYSYSIFIFTYWLNFNRKVIDTNIKGNSHKLRKMVG